MKTERNDITYKICTALQTEQQLSTQENTT